MSPDAYRLALQNTYKASLGAVCKTLLGFKDVNERTHKNLIQVLEHPHKRKLCVEPRGSLKTTIGVTANCVWKLINNPNLRIYVVSEVYVNSKNLIREIKGCFESEAFMNVFGDWRGERWGEGEITIKTRTKNLKEASITAGGIGTIKVGQHFDVIIIDDANSNKNSDTPEKCQKVIDFYKYLISILEPNGEFVIIGTRYSSNDLPQMVLDNCGIKNLSEIASHNKKILSQYS